MILGGGMIYWLVASLLLLVGVIACYWQLRRRHWTQWLLPYLATRLRRRVPRQGEEDHLLLCIADHYEPKYQNPSPEVAAGRVQRWVEDYPKNLGTYRDSDGKPPRHSFFFPIEEYEPEYLDALADLCAAGYGEVEVHLHHDRDNSDNLRTTLRDFKELLAHRHGLLARHRKSGDLAYGFIHGNWALDNSRPDGRWCGVNNELDILRETGCYADFTMPSAPDATQTSKINSIYYAVDDPCQPKSHDTGLDVGRAPQPANSLLMIQGPLVLNWSRKKWGMIPRVENGCLQGNQPAGIDRLPGWLRARVQIPGRPDWFFVKLHAHGTQDRNLKVMLGEPMMQFHQDLARHAQQHRSFHYHYVTAREMYNLVRAAESGWTGTVNDARDFELLSNLDKRATSGTESPTLQHIPEC